MSYYTMEFYISRQGRANQSQDTFLITQLSLDNYVISSDRYVHCWQIGSELNTVQPSQRSYMRSLNKLDYGLWLMIFENCFMRTVLIGLYCFKRIALIGYYNS